MSSRLTLALETGGLVLPDSGAIAVLHPRAGMDLSALPRERLRIVQPFRPDHDALRAAGYDCAPEAAGPFAATLVCLPRAKAQARALVAQAMAATSGPVIVDGAKTDGIDARVLALYAERVRPEPRPLPSEETRRLAELVDRRAQLLDIRTAERNRLRLVRSKPVERSLRAQLALLKREIARLDAAIRQAISSSRYRSRAKPIGRHRLRIQRSTGMSSASTPMMWRRLMYSHEP